MSYNVFAAGMWLHTAAPPYPCWPNSRVPLLSSRASVSQLNISTHTNPMPTHPPSSSPSCLQVPSWTLPASTASPGCSPPLWRRRRLL
jgi:hypothetical protein